MNTDPSSSPLAFFAAELKRLRGIAEMTQEQLAEATSYSAGTVASIETCRMIPSKEFAQLADKAFNSDRHLERLQDLVEKTSALPWFRDLVETERKAVSIQTYEAYLVPGLLQVEDYARHCIGATRPTLPDDDIARAVALRMTRQEILKGDNPVRLWAIIDESVLRRCVGGTDVMRAQCTHLLAMARLPHIAVQVIPESKGAACAYGQQFMILTFKNRPPIAYLEDMRGARYIREHDEVMAYSVAFDYLRSSALDDEQSAELIRGVMSERYI